MQATAELYEAAFERAAEGLAVHDAASGEILAANEAFADLVERGPDDVVGRSLADLDPITPAEDGTSVAEHVAAAADGSSRRFQCALAGQGDDGRAAEMTLEPVTVDGEEQLVSTLRAVGDREKSFQELAVEVTNIGAWRWEPETGRVEVNESFERLLGLEPGTLDETYEAIVERVHDDDLETMEEQIEQSMADGTGYTIETRIVHEDGRERWMESRGEFVETGATRELVGTITDVTERKERERELHELSSHLDIALGGASPAVWEWNLETDEVVWNDRFEDLVGLKPGDFEGTFDAFVDRVHPDDVAHVDAAVTEAIEDHELYQTEFRMHTEDDEWIWVDARGEVLTEDGTEQMIGIVREITERKAFQEKLAESNEALERLTEQLEFFNSILRHDVLNGMTVIKTRAELLRDELEGQQAQYADTIVEWCDTTTEVTERVRRVIETLTAPDEELELQAVPVTPMLERRVASLQETYPEVTFETDLEPDVRVRGDDLLSDVLGNLLSNGIEHNEEEGLEIEASVHADDEMVTITIADDGRGIPDERKDSVFRRGETSHAKESGSGFGLFFVDVMVRKYGGVVRVEDSDAGGARFVLELPRPPEEGEE